LKLSLSSSSVVVLFLLVSSPLFIFLPRGLYVSFRSYGPELISRSAGLYMCRLLFSTRLAAKALYLLRSGLPVWSAGKSLTRVGQCPIVSSLPEAFLRISSIPRPPLITRTHLCGIDTAFFCCKGVPPRALAVSSPPAVLMPAYLIHSVR